MLSSLRTITSLGLAVVAIAVPDIPGGGVEDHDATVALIGGDDPVEVVDGEAVPSRWRRRRCVGVVDGGTSFQIRSVGLEALSENNSVPVPPLPIQTGPSMNAK